MPYDFNAPIERRGTDSIKYDCAEMFGKADGLLPLWVADMDFALPEEILRPMRERLEHGVFGYSVASDEYRNVICSWFERRFGWKPDPKWIVTTPGVVFALATAARAFAEPGEAIVIQPPVYHPFELMITANGRRAVTAPLTYSREEHAYSIDFESFERIVKAEKPKALLLCNPQNPSGRVWTADELRQLGDICLEHDVVVVSDEIHADFTRAGYTHTVFASLGEEYAQNSVICTAASKTFNIAGLQVSNIFIPNPELRERFSKAKEAVGCHDPNIMGLTACRACYEYGEPWLEALKEHLEGNLAFMKSYLAEHAPQLYVVEPGSTYLPWVDCTALGLNDEELRVLVEDRARLWLNMGTAFGEGGSGFIRFNIACTRQTLETAVERLCDAIQSTRNDRA